MSSTPMTNTPSIERLKELLRRTTRVRDEIRHRDKGDGEERYDLIGDPCGFPVATFGDQNDALFDLEARKVIATLETLTPSAGEVDLDGATPAQMQRANSAVEANLVDGAPKYASAQGYACALTAIMQTDALASPPLPHPDIEGRAREMLADLAAEMALMLHGGVESPDYTAGELGRLPRWMTDMQNMLVKIRSLAP